MIENDYTENQETLKDKILNTVEKNYSFITALKDKAESIAKMSTLNLNDDELKTFYDNYIQEAKMLKDKIELKEIK